MCEEIGAYPYLFIVHRLSLLKQTHLEYSKYFNEPIGWIGNGVIDVQKINIASIATICSALKIKYKAEDDEKVKYTPEQLQQVADLLQNCKFLVHDELHHGAASTSQMILKKIKNADYKIGLSATPFRTDGADILLEASFGPIIYTKTASDLIDEGFLTPPKIYFCKYSDSECEEKYPKNDRKGVFTKVYKDCIAENEEYNLMIANLAISSASQNRSTLISVKQIQHGKNILKAFDRYKHNHDVYFLSGQDDEEYIEKMLKDFSEKKFLILISTLIDEGVDIPAIDAVINAGGGASAIKAIQLTGRALRQYPGKKWAYIYDFIHPFSHLYRHSLERIEILSREKAFKLKVIELS
jgi:superfamily II DNA or RNA helicase